MVGDPATSVVLELSLLEGVGHAQVAHDDGAGKKGGEGRDAHEPVSPLLTDSDGSWAGLPFLS